MCVFCVTVLSVGYARLVGCNCKFDTVGFNYLARCLLYTHWEALNMNTIYGSIYRTGRRRMRNLVKVIKNQTGLAVDEAILATAMVASLGAFVVVNVPWQIMFSASTQMQEELTTLETANTEFYQRHRLWPHQTTSGDWRMNASALVSPKAMRYPYNSMTSFKNYISDMSKSYSANGVRHEYGIGGAVMQRPVSYKGHEYIEIILEGVPLADARKLDASIDGDYNPDAGRVYLVFDETENVVDLHYRANKI
ncbi:MAG: hypothetical protein ACI8QY_001055 [bacterium]|jgi:hypothetical protein